MKIDWKAKNTKIVLIILAVIIVPILFNTLKTTVLGIIAAYQAGLPQTVQVSHPELKSIYPKFKTTGRVEAKYSVDIIARVDGWLQKSYFKEGNTVKKGQKLFTIEPDEYAYAARNAQATVNENRAVYNNSQIELKRAQQLLKEDLVSQEFYDNALTKRNRDRAILDGSIAQANKAHLNLSYTNITSPMDGRIGKIEISEGNFVTAASGALTTIHNTDPMRVTFTLKSSDFIYMKKAFIDKNINLAKPEDLPVKVRLQLSDGTIYSEAGIIEYIDNKIDMTTGSVTFRAIFDNPHEILMHGDYVGVILELQRPHKILIVPQSATKTDVGTGYYVWTVKDGKSEKRTVVVNDNIENNWVVEDGLSPDDTVVVKGIQSIHKSGQPLIVEEYVPDGNGVEESDSQSQTVKNENFFKKIMRKIKNLIKKFVK